MKRQVYIDRRKSLRSLLTVIAAITAATLLLIKLDSAIRPTVKAVCQEECRRYASHLINSSIEEVIAEASYSGSDFAEIIYNESGSITAIETHADKVNKLQSQLLRQVNTALDESRNAELFVSLGTASGVWIFAGRGPTVPLRFLPIGSGNVELVSHLESAGINQTCHKIIIEVTVETAAAIPFYKTETEVVYDYLLTETLLVGEVPEGYAVLGGS